MNVQTIMTNLEAKHPGGRVQDGAQVCRHSPTVSALLKGEARPYQAASFSTCSTASPLQI